MERRELKELVASQAGAERVERYFKQLYPEAEALRKLNAEQARVLAAVFAGSRALSEQLLTSPELLGVLDPEGLKWPRKLAGLWREVNGWLGAKIAAKDFQGALRQLRQFKAREMLRVAARDLARFGTVREITEELSNLADVCVEVVRRISFEQMTEKFGVPYTQELTGNWEPAEYCILGMGKLGGQELNYSSDIDVLFVYSGEGFPFKSAPAKKAVGKGMTNHQFFNRLSEAVIAEISRMTNEGTLFRIDLRLRPEGKSGPLSRSLASYENYYFQWGQTWERMMLIKARPVAGSQGLGAEFLEMVQPFRYPRSISAQLPAEVAAMKDRIEAEVIKAGEIERNVKLGRGGIREIEFLVQTLQVLHGGRSPFLQSSKTLQALEKLAEHNLLERGTSQRLKEAYCFLRDVEHRIQMEDNRQTHTLPTNRQFLERVAGLMGFGTQGEFEKALRGWNDFVRQTYESQVTEAGPADASKLGAGDFESAPERWRSLLAEHGFREPERGVALFKEFVLGPGFAHVSTRTTELALELTRTFLSMCRRKGAGSVEGQWLSDPDRVVARVDSFVTAYGTRALLYETWSSNRSIFKLLLLLFDRSEFLAELAIRIPDLLEQIELSGQLRRRKTKEQILGDLRGGLAEKDQCQWLRRYFQAEQMRLGLRDILGLSDGPQIEAELTALADAFLTYGLEVVMRKHKLKQPPFAIFGLGKLGGAELIYASDLDIIFVAPDATADLPRLQKIAVELMDLLSTRTEDGTTFETDARLRPDGEKGLLVNTVKAYREYYAKRAMLWEKQSISRFRAITGPGAVVAAVEKNFRGITDMSGRAASELRGEIHEMRLRIETQRTPAGKNALAIKTGTGGLMDAEFAAQFLCLSQGWHEPNTLKALERGRVEKIIDGKVAEALSQNYTRLMEIERILRRWSYQAESVLPEDGAALFRVSVRCGFETSEQFLAAIGGYRKEMREAYLAVMQG